MLYRDFIFSPTSFVWLSKITTRCPVILLCFLGSSKTSEIQISENNGAKNQFRYESLFFQELVCLFVCLLMWFLFVCYTTVVKIK